MFDLHHELSVLSRAVHFGNLSSASAHVGLSQPQLSRILSRLESTLQVTLLDRTSRRKSHWSPLAFRLAETYQHCNHKLDKELNHWIKKTEPTALKVGTLEGLTPLANRISHLLLTETGLKTLELDVYDLNELEELFLNGDLTLLFTSRAPGRRKYKFEKELGFQLLEPRTGRAPLNVLSPFEYGRERARSTSQADSKILISNSLEIRKTWIRNHGGSGFIPSEISTKPPKENAQSVLLIAHDSCPLAWWKKIDRLV